MEFDDYQHQALITDQFPPGADPDKVMIPLLGLAGEVGTLLAEFKKRIRDGESYETFNERVEEELGDVLWYLANLSSRLDIALSTVASKNLYKNLERWPLPDDQASPKASFDADFPEEERFPRRFEIRFDEPSEGVSQMVIVPQGELLGNQLTDNAFQEDGYRFHDVLHLAHMAVLGWSPVMRSLLKRKRKSKPKFDEVEDGGRAIVLEEALVAFVYNEAKERRFFCDVRHVQTEALMTIKRLVDHLEVRSLPSRDWERAILQGYAAFRHLLQHHEGTFLLDLDNRNLSIVK